MTEGGLRDHPQRHALANELHARPFPELFAPCRAVVLAIKPAGDAAGRDPDADLAHLRALLDRHGAPHPPPGANHYAGRIGRHLLRWERHTEFVTYAIHAEGVAEQPFSGSVFAAFPRDWLEAMPGEVLTSILVRVEVIADPANPTEAELARLQDWFVPDSLAMSRVADGRAIVAGDFRIDLAGHVRFAVLAGRDVAGRRLGRIVQRLIEIETYKSMAMLTLPVAREVAARVSALDGELSGLVSTMAGSGGGEAEMLDRLLAMSAEIEALSSRSAFRFGAAEAYAAILRERIAGMREIRIEGRQTLAEFMQRRFDPAMRTCSSAKARLEELSRRASRAATLLRTRVEVAIAAQNRGLLESMDRRAALQLRLQETVEGLSVVAISYYAVGLAGVMLAPLAHRLGADKATLQAAIALPVILAVWWMVRRLRRHLAGR
ncbi:MAG: DUF3422 domain-containing protein [Alphaproteobacteria bacterium]|nr:MAG: DUF3422 domain-containing protein [Alphaproteobacteria bacterium]